MNEQQPREPGPVSGDQQAGVPQFTAPQQQAQPAPQPPFQQYYAPPQQPGYAPQGAATPPRTGLPVGAWIGIGVGAFVLLAGMVVAAIVLFSIFTRVPHQPVSSSEPYVSPYDDGSGDDDYDDYDASDYSLDDAVDFYDGPFWSVPFEDGWDIDVFDVDGVNQFTSADTGCVLYTYQGYGDPAAVASDDRTATKNSVPTVLQVGIPWAATADPEVSEDGTVNVPLGYDGSTVEMLRLTADYPAEGGQRSRVILVRAFMPNNSMLLAETDCPATPAATSASQQVLDGLTISEY